MTTRIVALDQDERRRLLEAAKTRGPREHAMALLSIQHGLRASEVCELRLEDVDLRDGTLRIRRLKHSLETDQHLRQCAGRPLYDGLRVLKAWLRVRRSNRSPYLFTSTHGARLHRGSWWRIWRALAIQAGLPPEKRHPHVAKHTLGVFLAERNVNAQGIRQALGHRSLSSSTAYTGMSDAQADRLVQEAIQDGF